MSEKNDVASALVKLSFLVQSVYGEVSEASGLTPQQAQLLCVLCHQSLGMAQLAQTLGIEKSSLTGLVDRVEKLGLVSRQTSSIDARSSNVQLTKIGTNVVMKFRGEATSKLNELVACMPKKYRDIFTDIAGRIVTEHEVPAVFNQVS